ncbi:MAG: adenylosuccinate synthase [Verrucomicrobiales bacterium]|jgi:adenylosuccinate synthase|nr:adenylosuccinate synthase [Verrucomicrobiales bacterium]
MNTLLVGAQWGDEGKGKIVDVLTEQHDAVVRAQGGNNAGHTVWVGPRKYVLHLVPSGILRPDCLCLIGHGTVIDPLALAGEIKALHRRGINTKGRLFISDRAHLVMPYHRVLDLGREAAAKGKKIGTTGRGIGPTYNDKASRVGLRAGDLLDADHLTASIRARVKEVNVLAKHHGWDTVHSPRIIIDYCAAGRFLAPYITDTALKINTLTARGKKILFEGAQGTLLDIDCGTYPYVTSSNTTAAGLCTGSGLPPNRVDKIIGALKAYTSRVGEGPFPTEAPDLADLLHALGREFGATTGRPRRCGWLDAVLLRYAVAINGIDEFAITNLDGLDTLPVINIATAYRLRGKTLTAPPAAIEDLYACQPVYQTCEGWQSDTTKIRSFNQLPPNARAYLRALEQILGVNIKTISVGPRREQTFHT